MPLTAAERKKRRRDKLKANPETYENYLVNERLRWKKIKDENKTQTVANMTQREVGWKRRYWRKAQARCTMREKAEQQSSPPPKPVPGSSQWAVGGRRVARDKSRCYKELTKLWVKVEWQKKKTDMYRKRLERLNASAADVNSPRKVVKHMIGKGSEQNCCSKPVIAYRNYENFLQDI